MPSQNRSFKELYLQYYSTQTSSRVRHIAAIQAFEEPLSSYENAITAIIESCSPSGGVSADTSGVVSGPHTSGIVGDVTVFFSVDDLSQAIVNESDSVTAVYYDDHGREHQLLLSKDEAIEALNAGYESLLVSKTALETALTTTWSATLVSTFTSRLAQLSVSSINAKGLIAQFTSMFASFAGSAEELYSQVARFLGIREIPEQATPAWADLVYNNDAYAYTGTSVLLLFGQQFDIDFANIDFNAIFHATFGMLGNLVASFAAAGILFIGEYVKNALTLATWVAGIFTNENLAVCDESPDDPSLTYGGNHYVMSPANLRYPVFTASNPKLVEWLSDHEEQVYCYVNIGYTCYVWKTGEEYHVVIRKHVLDKRYATNILNGLGVGQGADALQSDLNTVVSQSPARICHAPYDVHYGNMGQLGNLENAYAMYLTEKVISYSAGFVVGENTMKQQISQADLTSFVTNIVSEENTPLADATNALMADVATRELNGDQAMLLFRGWNSIFAGNSDVRYLVVDGPLAGRYSIPSDSNALSDFNAVLVTIGVVAVATLSITKVAPLISKAMRTLKGKAIMAQSSLNLLAANPNADPIQVAKAAGKVKWLNMLTRTVNSSTTAVVGSATVAELLNANSGFNSTGYKLDQIMHNLGTVAIPLRQ